MDTSSTPAPESIPSPAEARPPVSRLRLIAAGAAFAGVAATAGIGLAIAGGGSPVSTTQQAAPASPGTQQTTPSLPQGWDTTAQRPGGHGDHHGTPAGSQGDTLIVPGGNGGPGHVATGGS